MTGDRRLDGLLSALVNDQADSRDDVRADLDGFGVDVSVAKAKFSGLLDQLERKVLERTVGGRDEDGEDDG